MGQTLCFDPVAGAAGDMILAALFDLGADPAHVAETLHRGGLHGFRISFERRRDRHHLFSGYCRVEMDGDTPPQAPAETGPAEENAHQGNGRYGHSSHHHHHHNGTAGEQPAARPPSQPHRRLPDILHIIDTSAAPARARERAAAIFTRLAEAEAAVHGTGIEEVHFHEVGAVDAIVDVFGTCLALEQLDVDHVYCAALKVGQGTVECAHGTLPVPAPATAKLLEGFPFRRLAVSAELTTPTGAAILTTLSEGDWSDSACRLLRTGVGHGTRDLQERPNILRAFLVETAAGTAEIEVLETDIDDESAEITADLAARLRNAGALDVTLTQLLMKKGRPGVRLSVLAQPGAAPGLADLIFRHSSTIGIRVSSARRFVLPRSAVTRDTPWGAVAAKRIERPNGVEIVPEYESCRELAERARVSVREVDRAARGWDPCGGDED